MKQLFWKEAMEARFLPITILLMSMTVLVVWYSVPLASLFVPVCCIVVGLIAGCSGIASEFGRGTITFLSSLPLSRKQVWLCKLLSAMTVSAFTCVLLTAGAVTYGSKLFPHPSSISGYNGSLAGDIGFVQWWIVPISMGLFGIACSVFNSTLVDRPLTAIILSAVTAVALVSVFLRLTSDYEAVTGWYWSIFNYIVMDIVACILLFASYIGFTAGKEEGLKRRVVVASVLSMSCLFIFGMLLMLIGFVVPQSSSSKVNYTYSESIPDDVGAAKVITINCPSAEINQTYVFKAYLDLATGQAAGLRAQDTCLTGQIIYPLAVCDIVPQAEITYHAQAPLGRRKYMLTIVDQNGAITETIFIDVTNIPAGGPRT